MTRDEFEASNQALRASILEGQSTSVTRAETCKEQGSRYISQAGSLDLDTVFVPLNPAHAEQLASATAAAFTAAQKATKEAPVQQLLVSVAEETQKIVRLPDRMYVDTSLAGLPILPSGRRAKPDLAGCEQYTAATCVSIVSEAKPTLDIAQHDSEGAYQVVQRTLQLFSSQKTRTKWIFATVGRTSCRIFDIRTANGVYQHHNCHLCKEPCLAERPRVTGKRLCSRHAKGALVSQQGYYVIACPAQD